MMMHLMPVYACRLAGQGKIDLNRRQIPSLFREWHVQYMRDKSVVQLYSAFTPLLWGLRQKWMIPSCFLRKVVKFFGKEHVNWSSISGVMIGRS